MNNYLAMKNNLFKNIKLNRTNIIIICLIFFSNYISNNLFSQEYNNFNNIDTSFLENSDNGEFNNFRNILENSQ